MLIFGHIVKLLRSLISAIGHFVSGCDRIYRLVSWRQENGNWYSKVV